MTARPLLGGIAATLFVRYHVLGHPGPSEAIGEAEVVPDVNSEPAVAAHPDVQQVFPHSLLAL